MNLSIIILAAGQGTRMRSKQPKVLHAIAGKSMLERVVNTAQQLNPQEIFVIYGYQGDLLRNNLSHLNVTWVEQKEQLTGQPREVIRYANLFFLIFSEA